MARLTERFSNGQAASYWCGSNCQYDHKYCRENVENCPALDAILEKLAHFEDLQEAGRLVELPCKVGDTVQEVDKPLGIIAEWRVTEFVIHEDVVFAENPYLGEYCDIEEFGKTVFLTREEAEAALKGGGADD